MLENPLISLLQPDPRYPFARLLEIAVRSFEAQLLQVMHNGKRTRKLLNPLSLLKPCRGEETPNMRRSRRPLDNGFSQHNCLGAITNYKGLVQKWLGEVV